VQRICNFLPLIATAAQAEQLSTFVAEIAAKLFQVQSKIDQSCPGDRDILILSDDFKVPDVPDAHWQVIDSKGNVYTLERLQAKNGKFNKSIMLPTYIPDVTRVQICCAFAETLLGEASFSSPVVGADSKRLAHAAGLSGSNRFPLDSLGECGVRS